MCHSRKIHLARYASCWSIRVMFTKISSERDYADAEEKDASKGAGSSKDKEPEVIPDSKLNHELQALCNLIFSTK